MGVSGTALLAQIPPAPLPPLKCTNTTDTYCVEAAAVYNAIMTNQPVPATTAFAADVADLQNLIKNYSTLMATPGNPLYMLDEIFAGGEACGNYPLSQQCNSLAYAVSNLQSQLLYLQQYPLMFPTQDTMTNLIKNGENMYQLNFYSGAFYDLFYTLNQSDIALSEVPSTSRTSKVNKSLPAPSAPATPAKGAAPTKK